jgi:excisionase family DNA binding protein
MSDADSHKLARHEGGQARHELSRSEKTVEGSHTSRLVACLLLVPSDAEPLLSLLEQLAATSQSPIPLPSELGSAPHVPASASDRWLEHTEAAKCLGVSKSTLYRYASQSRIEYRKIAGRLEYRQSVLEKHKQAQVRPARFPLSDGGIIRSALSSGK